MLSEEEIEENRIPKEIAKALGIEKEDTDNLIAFKENIYEKTVKENMRLKKQVEQLELDKQKLIEYLEKKIGEYDDTIVELVLQNVLSVVKGEKE